MSDVFPVPENIRARALCSSREAYESMYAASISDPESFWREQASRIDWMEPFHTVKEVSYASDNVSIQWYLGGKTNASFNCLDRHLATRGDQTALIFEPDEKSDIPPRVG